MPKRLPVSEQVKIGVRLAKEYTLESELQTLNAMSISMSRYYSELA